MKIAPSDYIAAGRTQVRDGFGRERTAQRIPGAYETLAETRARLAADPAFQQRLADMNARLEPLVRALEGRG